MYSEIVYLKVGDGNINTGDKPVPALEITYGDDDVLGCNLIDLNSGQVKSNDVEWKKHELFSNVAVDIKKAIDQYIRDYGVY